MVRLLKLFERTIITILIFMMVIMILLSTIELGRLLVSTILASPNFLLDINQLLDVFGFFLLILIGVELLETIKGYLADHVIHVEVVIEVALIAIARKVIILDIKEYGADKVLAIAALIVAIALAYYLEKRGQARKPGQLDENTPKAS
jgi:uncharacterized membrane protein (DUF373 family)